MRVCNMVKVKMRHFPPVVLETGLRGGATLKSCKSWTINTKEIQTGDPDKPDIYCHFKTKHSWVDGTVLWKKDIKRTKLCHILHETIKTIADCTGNGPDVVEAEEEPPDDPMDQMEILPAAKQKPRNRRLMNEARTVRMPEFPPGPIQETPIAQ